MWSANFQNFRLHTTNCPSLTVSVCKQKLDWDTKQAGAPVQKKKEEIPSISTILTKIEEKESTPST